MRQWKEKSVKFAQQMVKTEMHNYDIPSSRFLFAFSNCPNRTRAFAGSALDFFLQNEQHDNVPSRLSGQYPSLQYEHRRERATLSYK